MDSPIRVGSIMVIIVRYTVKLFKYLYESVNTLRLQSRFKAIADRYTREKEQLIGRLQEILEGYRDFIITKTNEPDAAAPGDTEAASYERFDEALRPLLKDFLDNRMGDAKDEPLFKSSSITDRVEEMRRSADLNRLVSMRKMYINRQRLFHSKDGDVDLRIPAEVRAYILTYIDVYKHTRASTLARVPLFK